MTEQRTPTPPSKIELERFLEVVEGLEPQHALYLDDVGWFQLRRYEAYEGRNPRTGERVFVPAKSLLMFTPDGNLLSVLNGRPREDLGDPTDGAPDVVIHRHDWARPIANRILEELFTTGVSQIAGFGTLRVERRELENVAGPISENRVLWEISDELRTRLTAREDR